LREEISKIKNNFSLIEERISSYNNIEVVRLREENSKLKMENLKYKTDNKDNDSFERGNNW